MSPVFFSSSSSQSQETQDTQAAPVVPTRQPSSLLPSHFPSRPRSKRLDTLPHPEHPEHPEHPYSTHTAPIQSIHTSIHTSRHPIPSLARSGTALSQSSNPLYSVPPPSSTIPATREQAYLLLYYSTTVRRATQSQRYFKGMYVPRSLFLPRPPPIRSPIPPTQTSLFSKTPQSLIIIFPKIPSLSYLPT